jgi:hypothetical protein
LRHFRRDAAIRTKIFYADARCRLPTATTGSSLRVKNITASMHREQVEADLRKLDDALATWIVNWPHVAMNRRATESRRRAIRAFLTTPGTPRESGPTGEAAVGLLRPLPRDSTPA